LAQEPPVDSPEAQETAVSPRRAFNLEQFMGVKMFAWVGGLALFLGVAFFVKYSFDNNLVPPELRVAIGFLAGLGLLVGGLAMARKDYRALSQTLCATGVVILYAVTFACHAVYHFEFFGVIPTFLLMALITAVAFLLSVRLDAMVVAILGILGGFTTPILLSTGQDNPGGLFGYIAMLDIGLIMVALNRQWRFLFCLGALGTAMIEAGWAFKFFEDGKYFEGEKILVPMAALLGFCALFLGGCWRAKRRGQLEEWLMGATLGLVAVTLGFVFWFLDFPPLAGRPLLVFAFVFLVDAVVVALEFMDERVTPAVSGAGLAVFGLLAFWTAQSLSGALLNSGLACYLVFAIVHSLAPEVIARRRGGSTFARAGHIFPIIALALVLLPVFRIEELSLVVWPFILLVDLLAIGLAALTASLAIVLAALALSLAAAAALIFKIPAALTGLSFPLFLVGGFAVIFVAACLWLVRRFYPAVFAAVAGPEDRQGAPEMAVALPPAAAVLPSVLLVMATLRLHLRDPSPLFGLALLLAVLQLGLARIMSLGVMPAVGLGCAFAVECAWHLTWSNASDPGVPSGLVAAWYVLFYLVFALFPFLYLRRFANETAPWAAAAMAGPAQFFLLHRLVGAAWPNSFMGLLPAAFAVPPLLSLIAILKRIPEPNPARLSQLAWFGGAALFFITLIFPVQFDREWITIGWALEGAALLWLFHRVPHPGLRLVGAGLLVAVFVRLALNPAVFGYHPRGATPILNWYLYAYGVATACLFAGARLLAPPRNLISEVNTPPVLAGLGTALGFLLLNIEIADYFSQPGSTLVFQFSGNFARDMSYSIGWALYALGLLVAGIKRRLAAARFAAIGLLCVTLLKLFFHDLANLGQLYRIGAFIGVAVIAMLASFAYQRFYTAAAKSGNSKNEAKIS
jgi:uncharacterized membrane protein